MAAVSIEPQAQSSQSASRAYHVDGDVSAPKLVWSTDPVYPKSARKGKGPFEGVCVVRARLNASGMPTDVEVVRSLAPDFDSSAVKAVRQYRFSPAMRSGVPVPVAITIEVNFKKY
jgi:protein TonB